MNPKNTLFLVVLTGVLLGLVWFLDQSQSKPETESLKVLPKFRPAAVTAVEVLPAGQLEIKVERTNGGWQLVKPLHYKGRSDAIDALIKAAADLAPRTFISVQMLKGRRNLNEEFGFDTPQVILGFQENGEMRTIKFGFLTAPGDEVYAQVIGVEGIFVLDADFLRTIVPKQADDWRDPGFVTLTNVAFNHLSLLTAGVLSFDLQRNATNQPWRMDKPLIARADSDKVAMLLKRLEAIKIAKFVKDDPKADLEGYGLQPAAVELRFLEGTNAVLNLQFGKSPTNDEKVIYARYNSQPSVLLIPKEAITPWLGSYQEFRDRHLLHLARQGAELQSIEVSGTEHFTVKRQGDDTWRVMTAPEFIADPKVMRAFVMDLSNLETGATNQAAVSDTVLDSQLPSYGLATPARKYILRRDTAGGSDTNAIIAELDFGAEKDGIIYARRGDLPDESSVYAVKTGDFAKLPAASLQLREHRIWNFTEDQVSRMFITQNGHTMELLHLGTNHWQIAAGSQGMINELQIEVGAQELGFLEAQEWVAYPAKNATDFGFTTNALKIGVELKTTPGKKMTVEFGGIAPDHLRYGGVPLADGQLAVFEFPSVTIDRIFAYLSIREEGAR